MADADGSMTGAQLLVKTLALNGVDRVFCVPGESYLSVLDALYDRQNEIPDRDLPAGGRRRDDG